MISPTSFCRKAVRSCRHLPVRARKRHGSSARCVLLPLVPFELDDRPMEQHARRNATLLLAQRMHEGTVATWIESPVYPVRPLHRCPNSRLCGSLATASILTLPSRRSAATWSRSSASSSWYTASCSEHQEVHGCVASPTGAPSAPVAQQFPRAAWTAASPRSNRADGIGRCEGTLVWSGSLPAGERVAHRDKPALTNVPPWSNVGLI
jgi:hypothetical protein